MTTLLRCAATVASLSFAGLALAHPGHGAPVVHLHGNEPIVAAAIFLAVTAAAAAIVLVRRRRPH